MPYFFTKYDLVTGSVRIPPPMNALTAFLKTMGIMVAVGVAPGDLTYEQLQSMSS